MGSFKTIRSLLAIITSGLLSTACGTDRLSQNLNSESFINLSTPSSSAELDSTQNFHTFFSNTYAGDPLIAQNDQKNPDKQLIKIINESKKSIDICIYHIDSITIANAIISAHERGVRVRMVIDTDTNKKEAVQKIRSAGVPIIDDAGRKAYMHNKFVIVDEEIIWTGSFNFTDSASWKHCDNVIKIKDKLVALNFIAEFEEMFIGRKFGRTSPQNLKHSIVRMGSRYVKTSFAPEENVVQLLISELRKAEKEIKFMSYSFTHQEIADIVIRKAQEGVKVHGIFEQIGTTTNSGSNIFTQLSHAKSNLYLYKNPNQGQSLMHHKVFIIDNKVVTTGSFNFSYNASNDNDENMLVITGTDVAEQYNKEFERIRTIISKE